ncbi:23S rRNA pseudouridine(2605) synthase RluB [Bacillus horti]
MILEGLVSVNGKIIRELGVTVDPKQDEIKVRNKKISFENSVYYIFYKPTGVITSVSDPQGRRVVMDYFRDIKERIYPIGRLDYDTSGLLLLSNDGDLTHQLMHPSFHVEKTYIATVQGVPTRHKLARLEKGIMLKDGMTAPARAELVTELKGGQQSQLRLTIHEGRNRQVRRMCKAIGHTCVALHRERYGCLTLEGLKQEEFRELTKTELEKLKSMSSHNFHK